MKKKYNKSAIGRPKGSKAKGADEKGVKICTYISPKTYKWLKKQHTPYGESIDAAVEPLRRSK